MLAEQLQKYQERINNQAETIDELYRQIGKLSAELAWSKKNLNKLDLSIKRSLVNRTDETFSITKQCEILGLNRSGVYYKQFCEVDERELVILNAMDALYTQCPFYGYRRMAEALKRIGYEITQKQARRCMRTLGLQVIYPKKKGNYGRHENIVYPYLLNDIYIINPNQVWATDITYIKMVKGFVYLSAIMDWFSRAILAWRISNSLEADFCIEALKEALEKYGKPQIFNSDQGSQFTSEGFTKVLKDKEIAISMDGRGRVFDNIMIERLWRTLKYEYFYINEFSTVKELNNGTGEFINFYNRQRPHSALNYKTPIEVYESIW
jgi:putative transposase